MAVSPIQIFDSAHDRATSFLKSGEKGPKAKDNLRAAVVFAVAAIDAFFRAKITKVLKEQRDKDVSKFEMPISAQKIIKEAISKQVFSQKEYRNLKRDERELVDTLAHSNKSSLFTYLDGALEYESFQSIEKMSEALKIMGKVPNEIWGRFDASTKSKKIKGKKKPGRPFKAKVGKKIDAITQMKRMFKRRHLIVHEADIVLSGKKLVGKERKIEYQNVKKWLEHSQKAIREINRLIV